MLPALPAKRPRHLGDVPGVLERQAWGSLQANVTKMPVEASSHSYRGGRPLWIVWDVLPEVQALFINEVHS